MVTTNRIRLTGLLRKKPWQTGLFLCRALADYARTPVAVSPVKSEALLRLLICDLVGEEVTRESLATLRDDIEDLERRLDDSEEAAKDLPHRAKYLLLAIAFLRRYLALHRELIDQVERDFADPGLGSASHTVVQDSGGAH
jgi:hypothetical protein